MRKQFFQSWRIESKKKMTKRKNWIGDWRNCNNKPKPFRSNKLKTKNWNQWQKGKSRNWNSWKANWSNQSSWRGMRTWNMEDSLIDSSWEKCWRTSPTDNSSSTKSTNWTQSERSRELSCCSSILWWKASIPISAWTSILITLWLWSWNRGTNTAKTTFLHSTRKKRWKKKWPLTTVLDSCAPSPIGNRSTCDKTLQSIRD